MTPRVNRTPERRNTTRNTTNVCYTRANGHRGRHANGRAFATFWQKAQAINPTTGGSPSIDDLLNFTIGTGAAPAPAPAPAPGVPAGTPAPPPGYPPGWVNPYPNGAGEGG